MHWSNEEDRDGIERKKLKYQYEVEEEDENPKF